MITLYHGTSTKHLPDIILNGIKPRGKRQGVWEEKGCPSREDMVYLTNSYAPFFAQQSCLYEDGEYIDKPVVLEICLSDKQCDKRLYPDEDYLEQLARDNPEGLHPEYFDLDLENKTKFFRERLEHYKVMWSHSLNGLGNVAYKGIVLPKFIKRYSILDEDRILEYSDPVISILNQRVLGNRYQKICREQIWSEPFSKQVCEVK